MKVLYRPLVRILLVTPRYPWPPRTGDRLRAVQLVELLGTSHEVTLLTPSPPAGAEAPPADPRFRHRLYDPSSARERVAGGLRAMFDSSTPLQSALFGSPDLSRVLRDLGPRHDVLILQLARLAAHLGDAPEVPLVIDLVDSLSLNLSTRAECDRSWLAPLLRLEARRMAKTETRLVRRSRVAMVVSDRDRSHLGDLLGGAGDDTDRNHGIAVVPVTVEPSRDEDESGRPSSTASRRPPPGRRPRLAFTGNLGYFPNRDAASRIAEEIWPRVRARHSEASLLVAGARPPGTLVRRLRAAGIDVEPEPDDLRERLALADVALAPLRCGSGLPIKILEAWATGTPVIASAFAAAGVSGRDREDLLIASAPDEWVEAVDLLLGDEGLRRHLVASARRRLVDEFSRASVRRRLEEVLERAG